MVASDVFEPKSDKKVCQGCPDRFTDCMTKTECQAKIEAYKKANKDFQDLLIEAHRVEQARVERIRDWLREHNTLKYLDHANYPVGLCLTHEDWQEFWKQEE